MEVSRMCSVKRTKNKRYTVTILVGFISHFCPSNCQKANQITAQHHWDRLKCTARRDRQRTSASVQDKSYCLRVNSVKRWPEMSHAWCDPDASLWGWTPEHLTRGVDAGPCDKMKHWPCLPDLLPPGLGEGKECHSHTGTWKLQKHFR